MLHVEAVTKKFRMGRGRLHRVLDAVTFTLQPHETYGLLGPSGSGKTTLARIAAALIPPDSGRVFWQGNDVARFSARQMRAYRKQVAITFQNPQASLDPKQKVLEALAEPLVAWGLVRSKKHLMDHVHETLEAWGLSEDVLARRPHELSGGQAQRVVLARSLSLKPQILIADEPTSLLDVSVQAQVLQTLRNHQEKDGLTIWLISHDEDLIRSFCHRVGVLNNGRLVAEGAPEIILSSPWHPSREGFPDFPPIPLSVTKS